MDEVYILNGFTFNLYEFQHLKRWLNSIIGNKATLSDLQKYIEENRIKNKTRLLNKLHADFVKLPD